MGTIKATNIEPIANNGTVTLGSSGDTFTVPSGVTVNMSSATQTGVGGVNTPAFSASQGSFQSIANNTTTKLTSISPEDFDTDNNFASDKFTPTTAGKYFFILNLIYATDSDGQYAGVRLYKNGSSITTIAENDIYNIDSGFCATVPGPGKMDLDTFF